MGVTMLIAAAVGAAGFIRYQANQNLIQRNLTEQAIAEKQRAQANFKSAREAVDNFLVRVAAERLEYVPKAEKLRKELLEHSLTFYDRFLKEPGNGTCGPPRSGMGVSACRPNPKRSR